MPAWTSRRAIPGPPLPAPAHLGRMRRAIASRRDDRRLCDLRHVAAVLLDGEMNEIGSVIKKRAGPAFPPILEEQRAWLRLRDSEADAATRRHEGGSMSAWTGWMRCSGLSSSQKVSRLSQSL